MITLLYYAFLIGIGYLCGKWAERKGYLFWAWFFSGGLLGAIVIACLPNINDLEEDKKAKQINTGNTIGIVIAVAAFVWGFATALK